MHVLDVPVTDKNFNEDAYLSANPDVFEAIQKDIFKSGRDHYEKCGKEEKRNIRLSVSISDAKKEKHSRIKPILRDDMDYIESDLLFDFLTDKLREQFNIIDTNKVSSNGYDGHAMELINKYKDGIVLDCGSGKRPVYFENVVNFEIVGYDTTDVRGVGEVLPFKDNSFDAVLSIAVLEHVKDPFQCAKEISRVLKPNGKLMCGVPFLQPLHGYPHHYYNMTSQGIENLFSDFLQIDKKTVYGGMLPIGALTWILRSWAGGLEGKTKVDFLNMKISELINDPKKYLNTPFVTELSDNKNFELASGTVLFATKPC